MGFFDSLFQLGAKLRGPLSDVLFEAGRQLPRSIYKGWRWARGGYSDAAIGRELLLWPFLRRLRSSKRWRREDVPGETVDATAFEGFAALDTAEPRNGEYFDVASPFGDEEEFETSGTLETAEEFRLLQILARHPDVLGEIIQREKSRGNPLFS